MHGRFGRGGHGGRQTGRDLSLIGRKENLEVNAELDGEPVKLFEYGGNVVGGY